MTMSNDTPNMNNRATDNDKSSLGHPSPGRAAKRKSVSALTSPVRRAAGKAGPHVVPANDSRNDVAILRRDGHDPAIVIGLALRYVRLGRDVPFAIVNKLFRHAKAGDGAARATVEMLRRRVEHHQHERWRRYVESGLRAPSLPDPNGQTADPSVRAFSLGGDESRSTGLVLVSDKGISRDGEAGR